MKPAKQLSSCMREILDQVVAHRGGILLVLSLAAFLEAYGDSCFQSALYRSGGTARILWTVGGAVTLGLYGLVVNTPRWDFGRLLGLYVVLFFVVAQILAKVRFNQSPTSPVILGGSLIVAGGLVISFWRA